MIRIARLSGKGDIHSEQDTDTRLKPVRGKGWAPQGYAWMYARRTYMSKYCLTIGISGQVIRVSVIDGSMSPHTFTYIRVLVRDEVH